MKLLLLFFFPILVFSQDSTSWREITPSGDTLTHLTLTTDQVRKFGRLIHNGELCTVENTTLEDVVKNMSAEMSLCSQQVKIKIREVNKLDSLNINLKKELAVQEKRFKSMEDLSEIFRKQRNSFKIATGVGVAGIVAYLVLNGLK